MLYEAFIVTVFILLKLRIQLLLLPFFEKNQSSTSLRTFLTVIYQNRETIKSTHSFEYSTTNLSRYEEKIVGLIT